MIDQETLNIFDKLYNETYKDILKYVVCNCSNMEDVKDIIQDIYVAILKKISKINEKNYKSYILGIARNKVRDYYRFKYRVKTIKLENIEIKSDVDIETFVLISDDIDKIWNFLKSKNVIIFKIFYLYYYCDTSLKNISLMLNISQSNVKNYLYRTLKQLNTYLKKGSGDDVK